MPLLLQKLSVDLSVTSMFGEGPAVGGPVVGGPLGPFDMLFVLISKKSKATHGTIFGFAVVGS